MIRTIAVVLFLALALLLVMPLFILWTLLTGTADLMYEVAMKTVRASVMGETDTVRHDPEKLAAVVIGVIDQQVQQRASYVKFKPATAEPEPTPTLPRG